MRKTLVMPQQPKKRILVITTNANRFALLLLPLKQFNLDFDSRWDGKNTPSLFMIDSEVLEDDNNKKLIEFCNQRHLPVFVLTKESAAKAEILCKKAGLSDFLMDGSSCSIICAKVKTHINVCEMVRGFDSGLSEPSTAESELSAVQDAAILCLAAVARVRDHSTGNHILRTQHYVKALAEHLRFHPNYQSELDDDETIELFYKTASLHDIGKVGIPDAILQKPGKLTGDEYEIMKRHTVYGYQAIHSAELLLNRETQGKAAKFLKIAQQVTLSHHERWDGKGYPQGLEAEQIPIVARLMTVADVYDAMISRRPYKDAIEHITAADVLIKGKETLFDPIVVDAFYDLQHTFDQISYILEDYFPSEADLTFHSPDEFF